MAEIVTVKHPAKYADDFIPIFAEMVGSSKRILDPFAGTGKIGNIKKFGFNGFVYANEIEREWLCSTQNLCDCLTFEDAEFLDFPNGWFDAIVTSPTYGNRMADHHHAQDGSKRLTYTHCLGRPLNPENTGKMQWGDEYRQKHIRCYRHLVDLLASGGKFIINVKDHIRKQEVIHVTDFHVATLKSLGLSETNRVFIETQSMGFGANAEKRMGGEWIIQFKKEESNNEPNHSQNPAGAGCYPG